MLENHKFQPGDKVIVSDGTWSDSFIGQEVEIIAPYEAVGGQAYKCQFADGEVRGLLEKSLTPVSPSCSKNKFYRIEYIGKSGGLSYIKFSEPILDVEHVQRVAIDLVYQGKKLEKVHVYEYQEVDSFPASPIFPQLEGENGND